MAFDIRKLQQKNQPASVFERIAPSGPIPAPDLTEQLAASVAAVAINRPRTEPPLTVTTIEGPVAAFGLLEYPEDPATDGLVPGIGMCATPVIDTSGEEAPPAPKARRGRPRKSPGATSTSTAGVDTAGVSETTAPAPEGLDPKALPAQTAPGCAPSAGDRHAAVCAMLAQARQSISEALVILGGES